MKLDLKRLRIARWLSIAALGFAAVSVGRTLASGAPSKARDGDRTKAERFLLLLSANAPATDGFERRSELRRDRRPARALAPPALRVRDHALPQLRLESLTPPAISLPQLRAELAGLILHFHARTRACGRALRHDGAGRDLTKRRPMQTLVSRFGLNWMLVERRVWPGLGARLATTSPRPRDHRSPRARSSTQRTTRNDAYACWR